MKVQIVTSKGSWSCATTGKGRFIQRLIPALSRLGVEITEDPEDTADISLGIGKWMYTPKAKKLVVRMGPAHFDKSQDYKSLNKRKIRAIKHSDGVIYQSEWCRKVGRKFMVPHKNETVIFNGAPILEHRQFPDNPVFIAATRKWIPQKRLKNFIEAYFAAHVENSVLFVFGEHGLNKKQEFIDSRPTGKVIFVGQTTPEVLHNHMREATALLHPVYLDAAPNVVVEALACGLPIVCGNQGGTSEIVKTNGITCLDKKWDFKPINLNKPPKLDIDMWARAIKEVAAGFCVLDNSHIDINNIAKQYAKFFQDILNG